MAGKESRVIHARFSETHLRHLDKIRKCGDFEDNSAALRFCVSFTKTILGIIPEAVAENYIAAASQPDGTTVVPALEPEGTTYLPGYPYPEQVDISD